MGSPVMKLMQIHRGLILATLAFIAGSFAFVAASAVADAKGSVLRVYSEISGPTVVVESSGVSGDLGGSGSAEGGSGQASVESGDSMDSMQVVGFVFGEPGEGVPVRVRAFGSDDVVCGTGDVEEIAADLGFFTLSVVGASEKMGCPEAGDVLMLRLLYGSIDDGVLAATNALPVFAPGGQQTLLLSVAGGVAGVSGWSGDVPSDGGLALLRWAGPSGMPMSQAVELMPVLPRSVWMRSDGGWRVYVPGAPLALQGFDVVEQGALVIGVWVSGRP